MPSFVQIKCYKQVWSKNWKLFGIAHAVDTLNDINFYDLLYAQAKTKEHLVTSSNPLGEGGRWTSVSMFLCFFSYLINFCRQWHLCEYLILGDLSTHLLGLVFSCLTSDKMRIWVPHSIKVRFFKSLFFKK